MSVRVERHVVAVEGQRVDAVSAIAHVPDDPVPGRLLLTHGAGGDLDAPGLVTLAEELSGRGHVVVRANLPYREAGRGGPPRAERAVDGFLQLAAGVRELLGGDDWLHGGKSYGGRVASLAAAESDAPPHGLVFHGYPLHPPGKPDRLRVDHWPSISVPTLFLQGTRDPFHTPVLLDRHLPDLGAPATVLRVEGGDHGLKVAKKWSPDGHAASEVDSLRALVPDIGAFVSRAVAARR